MSRLPPVSTVFSRAPRGLDAPLVRVEVHLGPGLPTFAIVGLPEAVVRESKERVRAALQNAGYQFPAGRITVNLAPADLPKGGGRFDLPIAVGLLAASGQFPREALLQREFYGELALGGELRETAQLLPALIAGARAGHTLILPAANAADARHLAGERLFAVAHLREVGRLLRGEQPPAQPAATAPTPPAASPRGGDPGDAAGGAVDLADIRGQYAAKRALEIAAAGGHAMLLIGPPGAGKSLLAQALAGLLPPLAPAEALEVALLRSAAGLPTQSVALRPFRAPQHTASVAALVGTGINRPGELSLAHHGVLFLDEFPEFARNVLEVLREPLERAAVVLARARGATEWPARFQLIAAMNPCPCGYAGDPAGRCACTAAKIRRYRGRLSGPLLDRIDIQVEFAAVSASELLDGAASGVETSAVVAARVAAARRRQQERQGYCNARLKAGDIARVGRLNAQSRRLVQAAIERRGLSARACHAALRLARTVADLAGTTELRTVDVAEALQLRALDRLICC